MWFKSKYHHHPFQQFVWLWQQQHHIPLPMSICRSGRPVLVENGVVVPPRRYQYHTYIMTSTTTKNHCATRPPPPCKAVSTTTTTTSSWWWWCSHRHGNDQQRRHKQQSYQSTFFSSSSSSSSSSNIATNIATNAVVNEWRDRQYEEDNEFEKDEMEFLRNRHQQPNLTFMTPHNDRQPPQSTLYRSMAEEREIRAWNQKHRHVRLLRDDDDNHPPPTWEQLERMQLQFQQSQQRHYDAARNVLQWGNEFLSSSSRTTTRTNTKTNLTKKQNQQTRTTANHSKLLQCITSFTHSYFIMVNHHRIYVQQHNSSNSSNNSRSHPPLPRQFWYQPEYRTTTFAAVHMAMDVLTDLVQQKIRQVTPNVVVIDNDETEKEEEKTMLPHSQSLDKKSDQDMKDAELLQYELDLHEGYINDVHDRHHNSTDNTFMAQDEGNEETDDESDDDDDDINMISNNDTMWMYYPGIIYNPLIQIWKHMSLHHHSSSISSSNNNNVSGTLRVTPPPVTSSTQSIPRCDGRIIAPEVAETLALHAAITANGNQSDHQSSCINGNVDSSHENELRSAQQVLEQFQQLILSVIIYTQYTNPMLLRQDLPHHSKNPKKVPYKLFYNHTTFNMILEVLMYQHQPKHVALPPTKKKKKRSKRKQDDSDYDTNLDMCPNNSDLTAAVMQNSVLALNDAVRKCIQQFHPKKDSEEGKIGILEDVVNNYDKYLKDLMERYWTLPTRPKRPVWQDEIEEERIAKEDMALQEAAQAGHFDEDGNPMIPEDFVAVPIRYTSVNPTTFPTQDSTGLGMLFRPDIHTYNLFMKTWALKCHDTKEAAEQIHRIYRDMQQEGFEVAPNVETYNVMFHFYSNQPDKYVHIVERLIQYLIEKQGVRNVQLIHWYYAIEMYTAIQKHKWKAKEYLENMIYSSHHHKFVSNKNDSDDPYAKVTIIAEDDSDLQSIAIIQRAAQLLMNMYRAQVQHHLEVIQHTNKYVTDSKQVNAAINNSTKEIDLALRNSFDLYIKLKETGFLEFSGEEHEDGYLKYRDEIRSTFMDIYAYAGQMENAKKIFQRIVRTNVTHYQTLIDAHGKHDNIDGAEVMYELMINDPNVTQLNCEVYTALMNGYANSTKYPTNQLVDSIVGVLHRMQNEPKCTNYNIRPDIETYNSLLKSLCDIPVNQARKKSDVRFVRAVSILDDMGRSIQSDGTQNGEPLVKPTISTYLKIVQTGLKLEDFDGVFKIVERMAITPISDTTPTKRYLNSESNHSIFHMYREVNTFEALDHMIKLLNSLNQWADEKLTLLRPTAGTYSVLYKACVGLNQLKRSKSSKCKTREIIKSLYEQMKGANINPNHSTYTELIDYYAQSKKRKDLEHAFDLLIELEEKNDPGMRSDERQYNALFYGYLNNIGDTAAAAQILFRYTKGYLARTIKDRPSGLLYQTILKRYIESDELIKGALFIDQIHILQRDEPMLERITGVTIQLDHHGVPHHLGPDVVTMGNLIRAIKESTWMEPFDKDFYKRLVTKHSDAIKRFHRKRIKIKRKAFLYA